MKEQTNPWELIPISIHKCGLREEMKLPYTFRDWLEDGLPES